MLQPEDLTAPQEVRAAWALAGRRDKDRAYRMNRDLNSYLSCLGGLGLFLEHARQTPTSNLVVDVGAGEALAINQLAELAPHAIGLEFAATGLTDPKTYDEYSENRLRYHTTGAEVMRGIQETAGLVAVTSITYSPRPDMVVNAFQRVLVPGGVVKAAFPRAENHPLYTSGSKAYAGQFMDAGFDVWTGQSENSAHVVVAIAPGGRPPYSAQEIFAGDAATINAMRTALYERVGELA